MQKQRRYERASCSSKYERRGFLQPTPIASQPPLPRAWVWCKASIHVRSLLFLRKSMMMAHSMLTRSIQHYGEYHHHHQQRVEFADEPPLTPDDMSKRGTAHTRARGRLARAPEPLRCAGPHPRIELAADLPTRPLDRVSVRSSFRLKWPRCAFFGDFTSSFLLLLFPTAPPLRLALVSSHCYSGRVVLVAVEYGVHAKTISGRPSGEQEKPAQRDHHLVTCS